MQARSGVTKEEGEQLDKLYLIRIRDRVSQNLGAIFFGKREKESTWTKHFRCVCERESVAILADETWRHVAAWLKK